MPPRIQTHLHYRLLNSMKKRDLVCQIFEEAGFDVITMGLVKDYAKHWSRTIKKMVHWG